MKSQRCERGVHSSHVLTRVTIIGPLVLLTLLWLMPALPAQAKIVYFVDSAGPVERVDTNNPGRHAAFPVPTQQMKAGLITFNITYLDVDQASGYGFDDPTYGPDRRSTVDNVLAYLSSVLNENGTCDIVFSQSVHGAGGGLPLIQGGTYYSGPGPLFTNGYAFQHITTNVDPASELPDLSMTLYFDWPWYTGSGNPGFNEYDLATVLLRQISSGLGLISLSNIVGSSIIEPYVMSRWDNFMETGNGRKLWNPNTTAFQGIPSFLTGSDNGLRFAGPTTMLIYGAKPLVYAPGSWIRLVSGSYWDPTGAGLGAAVMRPAVNAGDRVREYAPVDLAALYDIGFLNIVLQLPFAFTTQPHGGWYEVGQPLTLRIATRGTVGTVSYQWKKDGVALAGGTLPEYHIDALTSSHAGAYTCEVTDDGGVHVSETAHIVVFPPDSLPTTGVVGLSIVAVACVVAGAFIIMRKQ